MPWGGERQGGVAWETRCCVWRGEGGSLKAPCHRVAGPPWGVPHCMFVHRLALSPCGHKAGPRLPSGLE